MKTCIGEKRVCLGVAFAAPVLEHSLFVFKICMDCRYGAKQTLSLITNHWFAVVFSTQHGIEN